MKYGIKKGGAKHTPFNIDGTLNRIWVIENPSNGREHATWGIYPWAHDDNIPNKYNIHNIRNLINRQCCHATKTVKGSEVSYHYGYDNSNPRTGEHFWTSGPPGHNRHISNDIKTRLQSLYRELCNKNIGITSEDDISDEAYENRLKLYIPNYGIPRSRYRSNRSSRTRRRSISSAAPIAGKIKDRTRRPKRKPTRKPRRKPRTKGR